jgi:L,D-transpeptidase catalytic domain
MTRARARGGLQSFAKLRGRTGNEARAIPTAPSLEGDSAAGRRGPLEIRRSIASGTAASSRSRSGRTSLNRVRDPFISSPTTKTPFRARTRARRATQPSTIGTFVSSGCIRLTNEDVMDLYSRVRVGTRVVVLSGRPSTAAANSFTSPSAMPSGTVTAASPGPVSSPMAR